MTHKQDSPIIDLYPTNFKVDLNGKKYLWQGVALLPFVEEERLLQALCEVYPTLTPDEGQQIILISIMYHQSDIIITSSMKLSYPTLIVYLSCILVSLYICQYTCQYNLVYLSVYLSV